MPALDFSLGHRMIRRATNMLHFPPLEKLRRPVVGTPIRVAHRMGWIPSTSSRIVRATVKFQDIKWERITPELGEASSEIAILHVDPKTQATQLMIRVPKNSHVERHWHNANETHTIISGAFILQPDNGDREELGPGSFNYIPRKMVHQAWTKPDEGALLFITVDGAWDLKLGRQTCDVEEIALAPSDNLQNMLPHSCSNALISNASAFLGIELFMCRRGSCCEKLSNLSFHFLSVPSEAHAACFNQIWRMGVVCHTYSAYARGVGRNETGVWWRRHDEYDTR
jgi:quercetin dioxygenase-like cupin family protein